MKWIGHHMEIPSTLCSNVYDFAFCPEPCCDRLADLADPEDWGPSNRILKNYLSFSFSRAVFLTERDVDQTAPSNLPLVFDDDRCLFNTGLYTRRYETIYGLFEPNTKPDARQRWFLKGFFKESDPMLVPFEYLPCRVRFTEDPSELVFDYRLPIRSNIDHILGDEENLTRIPASLMGEGNSLLLRRAFEGAVVEAARRAAAPRQTAQRQPVSRQADPAQGTPQPKARKPRGRGGKIALRAALIVLAVIIAAGAVGMVLVAKKDAIFPNVSVCGTDVGGMTQIEAAEAIRAAGWDDTSAPVLTMTFPGDRTITVTATEIGFEATPDAAAEAAYAYGRSGNAFTNFFTWLRCALKGHDVAADHLADMDTDALRTRIEREAAEINVKLSGGSVEIDEEHSTIRVVKGASMITQRHPQRQVRHVGLPGRHEGRR